MMIGRQTRIETEGKGDGKMNKEEQNNRETGTERN